LHLFHHALHVAVAHPLKLVEGAIHHLVLFKEFVDPFGVGAGAAGDAFDLTGTDRAWLFEFLFGHRIHDHVELPHPLLGDVHRVVGKLIHHPATHPGDHIHHLIERAHLVHRLHLLLHIFQGETPLQHALGIPVVVLAAGFLHRALDALGKLFEVTHPQQP